MADDEQGALTPKPPSGPSTGRPQQGKGKGGEGDEDTQTQLRELETVGVDELRRMVVDLRKEVRQLTEENRLLQQGKANSASRLREGVAFHDLHHGKAGCTISEVELRAITVPQLHDVVAHIKRRCEAENWENVFKKTLTAATATLYDVCDRVIKPSTKERKCSFVELVAAGEQKTKWFCSHWWGEPVLDFVACIETHAEEHGYGWSVRTDDDSWREKTAFRHDGDSAYWVCAYANNQWDLGEVNTASLEETSFFKALKIADGALSVLDKDGMCFKRVWCAFECYVALTQIEGFKYEVYTAFAHKWKDDYNVHHVRSAVGITDGPAFNPHYLHDAAGSGESMSDKALRQEAFPLQLIKQAFDLTVETAEASVEADRVKILNTIAQQPDLAAEPQQTHEDYDKLNAKLRGRFAITALRPLQKAGEPTARAMELLRGCGRKRLEFNFEQGGVAMEGLDADFIQGLMENLPPELEELNLSRSSLGPKELVPIARALRNPDLKFVVLNLYGNNFAGLNYLFEGTHTTESLLQFAEMLKANTTIKKLQIDGNRMGDECALAFAEVFEVNETLERVDIRDSGMVKDVELEEPTKDKLRSAWASKATGRFREESDLML